MGRRLEPRRCTWLIGFTKTAEAGARAAVRDGWSGNPGGRRTGSRNKATLAAAVLLAGKSEALTRRAVELALAGDPTAMRLCLERILPPCRGRAVKFALPPIESARDKARGLKAHDIAAAMKAVTSALASGAITPGEAERIAAGGRHLCLGDRRQRFRPAPSRTRRRVQGARGGSHCRLGIALAPQPIGGCLLLICCRCSNVKQSVQFLIASRGHAIGRAACFLRSFAKGWRRRP
jgi:hypothetical protein